MANKKSVRKKAIKKKSVARTQRKSVDMPIKSQAKKKGIVIKNLALFVILFVASILLRSVSTQEMYSNLFFILSFIFGFVSIAFLIVYLVFFFRKVMK